MMRTAVTTPPRSDPGAFVARHHRGLLRWLRALGCEATHADDHCQDALVAALQHGIDARDPATASRWLRTVTRNLFWRRLRNERRQPVVVDVAALEAAWVAVRGDEDGGDAALAALRACLEAAEPRDRELLHQRYHGDRSRQAMADAAGLGAAGVKQALRRARARLQHCMELRLRRGGASA
jgi:RNA polymerase sigma-70 factor (ECF subfamily)